MEKSGKPRSNFLCTPPLRSPTLTSYSPFPFPFSFTISLHFLFPRLRSPHFLGFPPCSLPYPIWQGVIDNRRKEVSSQFIRDRFLVTESKWTALNVHVHPNKGCSLDTLYLNIDVSLSFFLHRGKRSLLLIFELTSFFLFFIIATYDIVFRNRISFLKIHFSILFILYILSKFQQYSLLYRFKPADEVWLTSLIRVKRT